MSCSLARPFALSFALHLALGVALLLPMFLLEAPPKVTGPVMTLVADALAAGSAAVQSRSSETPAVNFTVPRPPPVVHSTPAADVTVSAARPSASEPAARASVKSAPDKPVGSPAQKTTTTGQGKPMTLAEFRAKHASPPTTARAVAADRPVPRVSERFDAPGGATPERTARVEEQGFGARLVADLRAAFVSPGAGGERATTVTFVVLADGRLARMRVVRSSGSPDFDAAVLQAFELVRAQGITPRDVGETFEATFVQGAGEPRRR